MVRSNCRRMVLGFSTMWRGQPTHFEEHILSGRKWHTLRLGNRWSQGRRIHFATGVRTKNYRQFAEDACLCTQAVVVTPSQFNPRDPNSQLPRVLVKRGPAFIALVPFELLALAINDGFDSVYDFNRWILDECKASKRDAFRGQIVMWNLQPGPWPTPY